MTTVSVCVPAYRSGPLIAAALGSLQRQSHQDIRVHIAVDPPEDGTLAFVAPFLADRRFQARVNSRRLGWDGNIRGLLERVETPVFMILMQDDLLHGRAVEVLLGELEQHSGASVAYADMQVFGACRPFPKLVDLPRDGTREDQLLGFFLAGAEAVPWRGVTRSEVIARAGGFPVDGFKGFAVECEWALRLLQQGAALRVPRRLYFKRIHPHGVSTASRARIAEQTPAERRAAWERHRSEMLAITDQVLPPSSPRRALVIAAVEMAMWRRLGALAGLGLSGDERRAARDLAERTAAQSAEFPAAAVVAAELRHLAGSGGASHV